MVHLKTFFLILLKEIQDQNSSDAIVLETPCNPASFVYLVGKEVQLLHRVKNVVVANATIGKGLGVDDIMYHRQQQEVFYLVPFCAILNGNAPLMIQKMDNDPLP